MIDGYQGYERACVEYDIQRLGCWAHARRKFIESQKGIAVKVAIFWQLRHTCTYGV